MHDCGVDHDIIDALPVFCYEELMGLKEPFDCAVCLCEFTLKDSLRLLPLCSHAFHIYCIDTWLLSNSTCPLCRGSLFGPGFEFNDSRDGNDAVDGQGYFGHFGHFERCEGSVGSEKRVYPVRVGSFRAANVGKGEEKEAGETSNTSFDDGEGHFGHFKHSNGSVSNEKRMYPVRIGSFRVANVGKRGETEAGETSNGNFDEGDDRQGHFGHFKHSHGSISNEKRMYPVIHGSFRATNDGKRGEIEAGETSNNSTFDDGDDHQGHFGHFKNYDGSTSNEKRVSNQGHSGHFKQPEDSSIGIEKRTYSQGHSGHYKQPEDSTGNEKRVYDQGHFGHFKQPEDIIGNEKRMYDQGHFGHFKQLEDSIGNEKRMYDQGHFGHFKQLEDSIGNEKRVYDQGHFGHFKQFEHSIGNEKRVYQVKLGKFRATNIENGKESEAGETSNNNNVDARRCYSMGTYEYVVGNSELRVEYVPSNKSSRGSFGNKDKVDSSNDEGNYGKKISSKSKGESFSVSKIWLWSKKDHQKSQLCSGAHMVSSSVNIHS